MLFILFKYLKYCLISFQPDFGKGLLRAKRRANKSIMNLSTFFGLTKLKHLTKEMTCLQKITTPKQIKRWGFWRSLQFLKTKKNELWMREKLNPSKIRRYRDILSIFPPSSRSTVFYHLSKLNQSTRMCLYFGLLLPSSFQRGFLLWDNQMIYSFMNLFTNSGYIHNSSQGTQYCHNSEKPSAHKMRFSAGNCWVGHDCENLRLASEWETLLFPLKGSGN